LWEAIESYRELLRAIESCRPVEITTKSYRELLRATESYRKLYIESCREPWRGTGSYRVL
jgi:hypothetical protein